MKKIVSLLLVMLLAFSLCACGAADTVSDIKIISDTDKTAELKEANIYVLAGPTGIGAANLKEKADSGKAEGKYNITIVSDPTEVVAKISKKEADIAAIATNLASNIYNKTNGEVTVLAVNTLGVLNVVTPKGVTVESLDDLKGKKIYTTGQGSNPEYIINYLLENNNIDKEKDLTLEFKTVGDELLTVWATDPDAVIIAPQPVATALTIKNEGAKIAIDLTKEWEKINQDSALMMGCIIVRNEFLKENKATVDKFLEEYEASIKAANENLESTGALCQKYGIVANAAIATKAIPNCNLCFVTGNEMKTKLSGYLEILFNADTTAVGGKLPADGFYYVD